MINKFYPIDQSLIMIELEKPFSPNGSWRETWIWEISQVKMEKHTLIKCVCCSKGRNEKIDWFEVEEHETSNTIRKSVLKECQRS